VSEGEFVMTEQWQPTLSGANYRRASPNDVLQPPDSSWAAVRRTRDHAEDAVIRCPQCATLTGKF